MAGVHGGMVERRVRREIGSMRPVAGDVTSTTSTSAATPSAALHDSRQKQGVRKERTGQPEAEGWENGWGGDNEEEGSFSPEQLQALEAENSTLQQHFSDSLSQVRSAESSLLEISSLQQTLSVHLAAQSESISQLVADSLSTEVNVGEGNKELKRAAERGSTARWVFWASCGLCAVLVTWDLVI